MNAKIRFLTKTQEGRTIRVYTPIDIHDYWDLIKDYKKQKGVELWIEISDPRSGELIDEFFVK